MYKDIKKDRIQIMKKYNSVKGMLSDLVENKTDLKNKLEKIEQRQISKVLKSFRLKYGLTQKDVASRMDCNQSAVSKLEKSNDDNITIGELKKYLFSLKMGLGIDFREKSDKINRVKLIKYHVNKIENYLTELEEIAKDDEKIKLGIYETYLYQIKGLLDGFGNKIDKFRTNLENKYNKKIAGAKKEQIHISLPYDISAEKQNIGHTQ